MRIEAEPAPKSAAIVKWDSLDDAVTFYKSKARMDLKSERDKAKSGSTVRGRS
jgi:uncharacterized protein (DUF1330 family)